MTYIEILEKFGHVIQDYFEYITPQDENYYLLVSENISFEYETLLYAPDGTMYLPDFSVTFRGDTYYWEHVGMLDNPGYKAHWEKKQKWYNEHFPGKLIVTYEDADLTTKVKEIIDNNK